MLNYYNESLPDYYPTMYRDGYTPEQILQAQRQTMQAELTPDFTNVLLRIEVKHE